ncbi:MAG: nitronate monooxygenase [Alphaproteobacteria bacterium GM7ARS4]|nr:nitronate monooxygenase [Alphaproteobacteria bacterium GM7ARS4]
MCASLTNSYTEHKNWRRGANYLGVRYPIISGAMTWVSECHLVAAVSNAGGFGMLAAGAMNASQLREEVKKTRALTEKPFGVNVILAHPEIESLLSVCLEESAGGGLTHMAFAGGMPKSSMLKRVRAHVHALAFAPSLAIGRKLLRSGADALILEGMEAGGHIGSVSTTVLAQEILPFLDEEVVFVAGGIGHGSMIARYIDMGASGVQLGTCFVCAEESIAHEKFKQAFISANARDAQPSPQLDAAFPVMPVRALANKATKDFLEAQKNAIHAYEQGDIDKMEAILRIERFWAGALQRAVIEGDVDYGSLMAGQSVGMVKGIESTQAIIDRLVGEMG